MPGCQLRKYLARKANLRNCLFGKKFICFTKVFTYTIYSLITHKLYGGNLERKPQIGFYNTTQHTHLLERELLILSEKSLQSLLLFLSLSHCYSLKGYLYPNITHTFSKCSVCFGAQEALGIFQKKPMRLGRCNRAYYEIRIASEDKTPRSSLVAGIWMAQEHWVDQAQRIFYYSCTPTYLLVDQFRLGRSQRGFSLSSSISSSITHLGVILCLHLSSLTLVLYIYCLLFMFMHQSSYRFIAHIYSCSTL